MIISNNIQNPKIYLGNSDVLRIYQGLNMIYGQSAPVEPCFEVVNLISSASGDFIDVYELSTSKWYKKNNLNAYEQYGVMESVQSLQNATYYTGKLVILSTDNHEYKWTGSSWSDLGAVGDSYEFYEDFVVNSSYDDSTHYFDTGYELNNNITKVWAKYYATKHSNDFMLASIQGSAESPTWKGAGIQYFGSINYIGYNWRYGTSTEGGTNYWISYNGGTDVEVEIDRENNTVTCNGNTRTHTHETPIGTGYTVKVFQHPNASSSKAINSGDKFYGYKIWESGELAVDLVPAKRVGDEAIGMYDKERGIFIAPHATTSMTLENKTGGKEGIPESYQTKVAPANNVHYDTLDELELMECPWIGMRATIGEDNMPYVYTENGWEFAYIIYGTTTGTSDFYIGASGKNTSPSASNGIHLHVSNGKFYATSEDVVGQIKYFYHNYNGFNTTQGHKITKIEKWTYPNTDVVSISDMFHDCSSLKSIDLSNFNAANVTGTNGMFYNCSSLTNINFGNFNTSNVNDMSCMFYGCSSLTSLDLSSFDLSNVNEIGGMFWYCSGLTSLDLSNFVAPNIKNTNVMFSGCSRLTSLNLSGFDTTKSTDMSMMFQNCSSLNKLILGPGFFNSSLSTFNFSDLTAWTDADSLETLVQAIEANPKIRGIMLSTNTKNALTQAQKDRITAAGWTIG